jgi:tetratricopeptide (TPR) repeat protein
VSLERIEITPFAVIAGDLLQNRRTGYLTVLRGAHRTVLHWSQGELVMAAPASPEHSLADFLVRRGRISAEQALQLASGDANHAVGRLHESGLLDLSTRQSLLREWLTEQFIPLFSLDEGTAAFTDDEALPPEQRVFLPSTAALIVEGVRSITNGLVLRRSLGDLQRRIHQANDSRYAIESLPMTDPERAIAATLTEPVTVETFLKSFASNSGGAAKVMIAMLAIGVFETYEERVQSSTDMVDMQRDMELLAAIGSEDRRSLKAIALSRQLNTMDHYQILDLPRATTRAQIVTAAESMRRRYDPTSYPPILRDALSTILKRITEAEEILRDSNRRATYDKLLQSKSTGSASNMQQRITQRSIAEQNFVRAKELTAEGDYYGAIVLLKQAVQFVPDHSDAWALLAACQERNPKWRRDAAESYQRALSINPDNLDAMISLGDLYKTEGMISRAQTCYEDVLKVAPENQQAQSRLQGLKKR